MRESQALGFWAKHCWAMDEFAAEDNLPSELDNIRTVESLQKIVNDVIEAAEVDVTFLLRGIQEDVEAEFGRPGSPIKLSRKRSQVWQESYKLEPRQGKIPQQNILLGIEIVTGRNEKLYLYIWLWAKGGKSTERTFQDELIDAVQGSNEPDRLFSSGVAVLGKFEISAEQFKTEDAFAVDLDEIRRAARDCLRKQTNDHLKSLIRAFRGN